MFDSYNQSPEMQSLSHGDSVSTLDGESGSNSRLTPADRTSRYRSRASKETPRSIRWVRRILTALILLCLGMAAWVWAVILHDLP